MVTTEVWNFRDEALARIDLHGYEVHARDGAIGRVVQAIEGSSGGYLIVDPGVAMPLGRQLLVPAGLVDKVDVDNRRVSVKAEREQIRNAPEFHGGEVLDKPARTGMDEYFGPLMGE